MPDIELRRLFARLNRNNMQLNDQELRHATYWGPFISLAEEIAENSKWADLGLFTPNDVRRMLDVEYVSELLVATLHGPQNKKDKLDTWYQVYEEEFDAANDVKRAALSALDEMFSVRGVITETRWRKKSDAYTLFCVLSDQAIELPLSGDQRTRLGSLLRALDEGVRAFSTFLDELAATTDGSAESGVEAPPELDLPEEIDAFRSEVFAYARAVSRAASDIGNRRTRADALKSVLSSALS